MNQIYQNENGYVLMTILVHLATHKTIVSETSENILRVSYLKASYLKCII